MTEPTEDTLPEEPAAADTSPEESEASPDTQESDASPDESSTDDSESTGTADTEEEIPLEELKKGYLRQSDYTRKAQEIAEQRKAFEAARAEFEKVRDTRLSQADNAIQLAAKTLQADFAKVDWNTLAQTDPAGYVQRQHEFAVRQAELNQAWQALEAQKVEKERESQANRQKRLSEQEAALLDAIPEWRDPAKRAAETTEFVTLARKSGISDAELEWISENGSAGMVALLRDAMRFRKVEKQLPKAKPVTQAPPPPPKVTTKAPVRKDLESVSMEEFVRMREEHLRRKAGR